MFICLLQAGYVVIADLSDPLLTSAEANSIFHVLLQQFTRLQGKQRAATGMLAALPLPTFLSIRPLCCLQA